MIALQLRIVLVAVSVLLLVATLRFVRARRIPVKYSLFWILAAVVLMAVALFSRQINLVTKLIGFETTANFVIGVFLVILLFASMVLMLIVSKQKRTLILLIQEISLLKKDLREISTGNSEEKGE